MTALDAPVNRTTGARPGGRSARVVAAVHEATLALMAEVGVDGFEITDVAERAGVNKTTVYRRWPTKARLVADTVLAASDHRLPEVDTESLAGDLTVVLEDLARLLHQPAVLAGLRFGASQPIDSEVRAVREAFWTERFARTGVIVERAIARGELPAGTDARLLLEHASSPIYFRALVTHDPIGPEDIATFVRRAIDEARRHGVA